MRLLALSLALAALAGATSLAPPRMDACHDLSCATKEELLEVIRGFHQEREQMNMNHIGVFKTATSSQKTNPFMLDATGPAPTAPTCNICASAPCQNGGTCHPDPANPWSNYYCECPDVFAGDHCEKNVTCTASSCGPNTQCYVSNHQANCICKLGYSGKDPQKQGCQAKIVKACGDGDPHYVTFDQLRFDYQGTCPYVFSKPCGNLTGGFNNYNVVAKNELVNGQHVSVVSEVEVTMYSQKVHIDRTTRNVYFNGYRISVPYYYPSKEMAQVSVTFTSNTFYVFNDQLVTVTFTTGGQLCIEIPDRPEFFGNHTLCGVIGNYDNNYMNDVVYSNGTVYPIVSQHMPTAATMQSFNHAEDTWITQEFLQLRAGQDQCISGETLGNNSNCNPQPAVAACFPIEQAASGQGVFANCQPMGNDTIQNLYDNCVFDVCHGTQKCDVLTNFVRQCQTTIPNVELPPDWRTNPTVQCPMTCPPNSGYTTCASACPATCSDQSAPYFCDKPCTDGCTCLPGYVLDTSQLSTTTCIPVESCGCNDPDGNLHPANTPWLSANCSIWAICRNGTYNSKINECSKYGYCGRDGDGNMACECDQGFRGDGYNCTDINECVEDPSSCSQDKGQGICINTPGSYNCSCSQFYTGRDCQYYQPRRHCADLYRYWGIRADGVNSINPVYSVNGMAPFSPIDVYCDMTTGQGDDQGGWTLMSHDAKDGMSNKSFSDYVYGFGNPGQRNLWLGLTLINGMTLEMDTSLKVIIFRCARNGRPDQTTDCTYPKFAVGSETTKYAVTIPQTCQGTENTYYDGWARWNLTQTGPAFSSYDSITEDGTNCSCSRTYMNTGWWYDHTMSRCGSADLNGVRYSCANQPDDSSSANYLFWDGSPIGDAWLWLRPKAYPNYDPRPPNMPPSN